MKFIASNWIARVGALLAAAFVAVPGLAQDAQRGRDLYLDAAATKGIAGLPSCVPCHGLPPEGKLLGATPAQLIGAFDSVIAMGRYRIDLDARDVGDLSAFLANPEAVGLPQPELAPQRLAFAALPATTSPRIRVRLANEGSGRLVLAAQGAVQVLGGAAMSFPLEAGTCIDGAVLAAASGCEFDLRFAPATAGSVEAHLIIRYAHVDAPSTVVLTGQTEASPAMTLSATGLNFGRVALAGTSIRTLSIVNGGQAELAFNALELQGPAAADFSLASGCAPGGRLAPGAQCDLVLSLRPQGPGVRQAALRIDSNAGAASLALSGEAPASAVPPGASPPTAPPGAPGSASPPVPTNAGAGAWSWGGLALLSAAAALRRRNPLPSSGRFG